ncbi:hypothetical protein I8H89_01430 [Candidatus Saccharibacteria bacterium]|nr:hypothetical protein [Candidatus Saccharibacteria bacterium]
MKEPKDWLDRAGWLRLLFTFAATLVFDVVLAVALLGYSRTTGDIDRSLGFSKLADVVGDIGDLLIAVAVIVAIVALAVITIEALLSKVIRYVIYGASVVLALVFHERIIDALTGISGVAIVAISVFVFVQTIVIFLIANHRKEVA